MLLSRYATTVYAQESNQDNAKDITASTKLNRITNLNLIQKETISTFKDFSKGDIDVVFAEPSQEGLSIDFQDNLVKLAPKKLVYISNNAFTLEKDTYDLSLKGYSLKKLKAYDLAPRTGEVTLIAILEARPSVLNPKNDLKRAESKRSNVSRSRSLSKEERFAKKYHTSYKKNSK